MNEEIPLSEPGDVIAVRRRCGRSLSWGAVFAGVVAATALGALFVMLGAGLGLALYTPITDANPVSSFGMGAIIIEGVSAVVALWFGGWVAGRFTPPSARGTGWLHGLVVWSAATVLGIALVSTGAGWAASGLAKLVGGGLALAGKPAAAVAGKAADAAKDAVKQSQSTISSFVDEAASNPASGAPAGAAIKTKRELGLALGRLFSPWQQANMTENHNAAVKVLVDDAGMSAADAEKEVTDWTASYQRLQDDIAAAKNQAEAKARENAEKAAKDLSIFSFCAFFAFVFGATAATFGGCHGACAARKHEATMGVVL